jgi:ABC-2 type transport system permease protein
MSTTSTNAPRGLRPSGGALVISQARYDLLSFLPNRQGRFFTLALPILFLVLLCSIFGNGTVRVPGGTITESTYYVPGLVALGVIQASFMNLVISITAQRESGILKRRRSTPVPSWVLIASRALICVGAAIVNAAVLIAIGAALYGARVPVRTIPAIIVTIAIGAIAFCALGYALVTAINSADSAQPVLQLVILPLYFISWRVRPLDEHPALADRCREPVPGPPPPAGPVQGVQPVHDRGPGSRGAIC